ncbi:hypothetical protein SAMN06295967_103195 [Belliella buryatensis]|uniref:DUF3311 domain-containing protein n=1 Tax=Belliella buryatensis TaxID=1500549 RepID=A0A239BTR5_9BACT|nr:hypothetical protein [Belliella buryatensis]SNS10553.1 hypothetical protein SAMN06295967_103195 [Belliella buryatensis]
MKEGLKKQYLWAVFFLGMFLLNYPVLSIYDIPEIWLGIPVLYLLVFAFWFLMILLTYWVIKKTDQDKRV